MTTARQDTNRFNASWLQIFVTVVFSLGAALIAYGFYNGTTIGRLNNLDQRVTSIESEKIQDHLAATDKQIGELSRDVDTMGKNMEDSRLAREHWQDAMDQRMAQIQQTQSDMLYKMGILAGQVSPKRVLDK